MTHPQKPDSMPSRLVGFIDILGFAGLVRQIERRPKLFRIIRDTLDIVMEQERRTRARSRVAKVRVTAFSDCYVISAEPAHEVDLFSTVHWLAAHLLTTGILTRGAIVFGPIYHRGRTLFGPAVVEAHDLERQVAYYPRVVVSEEAMTRVAKETRDDRPLRRDRDGCWYIDVFDLFPSPADLGKPKGSKDRRVAEDLLPVESEFARDWRASIAEGLREQLRRRPIDLRRLVKWEWLAAEFNRYHDNRSASGVRRINIEALRSKAPRMARGRQTKGRG